MRIETLVVGRMAANCYLVNGIIIDPGDDAEYIISHITIQPTMIVATHGHFDHIMAARALQLAYNIPFIMRKADAFLLQTMQLSAKHFLHITTDPAPKITKYIEDGDTIGNFTVMYTPGHTPGSICLYSIKENVLFSGDTIFAGGAVGRTDHKYSSAYQLSESVQKILSLPKNTRILPGHGQATNVRQELNYH